MPTRVRTIFDTQGSYQPDAFDQGDQFAAEMNDRRAQAAQQRLDRMSQSSQDNGLGYARIMQDALDRKDDRMAHAGDMASAERIHAGDRAADNERYSNQFNYLKSRDAAQDDWRKLEHDEGKPLNDARTSMMLQEIEQMKAASARRNRAENVTAPDLTDATPEARARYEEDMATSDPVQAKRAFVAAQAKAAGDDAETLGTEFANNAESFAKRDNKTFGWDPTEKDKQALRDQYKGVVDRLVGSGLSRKNAESKARELFKSRTQSHIGMNTGWTEDLARELGIQY